jgi:sigma-B regulation protein RsbU (phosphoserine phosphatase)
MFFAPLLLHLALIFPTDRPVMTRRRPVIFKWIYGFPVYVSICIQLLTGLVGAASQPKDLVKTVFFTYTGVVGIATLISIVRLIRRMRRERFREAFINSPFESMTIILTFLAVAAGAATVVSRETRSPAILIAVTALCIAVFFGIIATYPVATVVSLFRSYRASGVEERRQVKWPLWGTMVAVGARLLLLAIGVGIGLMLTFTRDFEVSPLIMGAPDIMAKIIYTLIPLSFAFAILKYRLMNIDVIIRRTVLYSILTGIVFVMYAVLVAGLGTALVKFAGFTNQTMLVASTVVIALVTVPIRNRLQLLVDRNLFRERRDYALALRNISNSIATSTAVEAFLKKSVEEIQQALQNRFVLLALRRDADFVASAKVGVADELVGALRVPVQSVDFESKTFPEPLRRLGTETIVPLAVQRDPKGLIALGTRLSDAEFSPADVEFIKAAAAQIAVGIENVRLRDEEVDFEQARAMQQILLPKSIPQFAGFRITGLWQPARSVGGDYYDTLALGENRAGICIADVAGKGMPAALLMANLQAAVKATASFDAGPAAVLERVKGIVSGNLAGGKFISLVYGVLDTSARTFTYCNAGHNPPIVIRASGEVERLMRGGPAVCRLFRDAAHEQETIGVQSGDRVVLFTDGVTEARRGEEEYGEERLIALLLAARTSSAAEIESKLLAQLREFTAGEFSDDVTLVIIAAE